MFRENAGLEDKEHYLDQLNAILDLKRNASSLMVAKAPPKKKINYDIE